MCVNLGQIECKTQFVVEQAARREGGTLPNNLHQMTADLTWIPRVKNKHKQEVTCVCYINANKNVSISRDRCQQVSMQMQKRQQQDITAQSKETTIKIRRL